MCEAANLPPVVGLCGDIGAGKDTAAAGLVEIGYAHLSFAAALKESVARMFPWVPRCHFFGTQEEKAQALFVHEGITWTGRRLLEFIGTNLIRETFPDAWMLAAMFVIDDVPGRRWVISDVRFVNEFDAIHARGGVVWEVVKLGAASERTGHASDEEWRSQEKDAVISARAGDMEGLQRMAVELARSGGRVH